MSQLQLAGKLQAFQQSGHRWIARSKTKKKRGHCCVTATAGHVRILDTTLRDGEQSPGAAMTTNQKLQIARQLRLVGVDVIDAGYPFASPADMEAVKMIAREVGNVDDGHVPVIAALARCNKADIDAAWEALRHARRPMIIPFISTSDIHLKHKLNMSRDQALRLASDMVAYARSLGCLQIEFAAEDASRTDPEFLYKILGEVIKAGATTVGIGDTVGYLFPSECYELIAGIKANTPGIENAIISIHCHNDLGLATANTLAGALAGAGQLEVTVNGIGERAGNASLEEVSDYTGIYIQSHKAIVGANTLIDNGVIHQLHFDKDQKELALDEGLRQKELALDEGLRPRVNWSFVDLQVTCGTLGLSTASIKLIGPDGKEHCACGSGAGPIGAAYRAIDNIVKVPMTLLEYSIRSTGKGVDASACTKVLIRGEKGHSSTHALTEATSHRTFSGTGTGSDVVISSVNAYLRALNKMQGFQAEMTRKKQRNLLHVPT
ncbi:2-isopropylmalate synthase B isoform X3 [Cryptomeria japonica]|uniref:2-isopropylmalate synthase B isoform X3 n=1 Tax=Cryptomeria japonica TaxID=3369 RepID=UPI0027DA7817|nr:2-isopropylmalate synthase B isoform X3 [Cryptomeria japonica]